MKLGFLGAGFIAQVAHIPAFRSVVGATIAAIYDPRDAHRAQVAADHAIPVETGDLDALLADPAIDALVVSLPRRAMAPATLRALQSGKHVLSEKPLAYRLADARMLEAARRPGQVHAVGFMKRYDPGVALFRERLANLRESGEFGAILGARMRDYCATYAVPIPPHRRPPRQAPARLPEWPLLPEGMRPEYAADFEYALNVLSHDIDLIRFLFGVEPKPVHFSVRAGRHQHAVLDLGGFDFALDAGPADLGEWTQGLEIIFERGRLALTLPSPLDRQDCARVSVTTPTETSTLVLPYRARLWSFAAQAEAFVAAIRGDARLPSDAHDAIRGLELIEALWGMVRWSNE